jgi:hypothetical protein
MGISSRVLVCLALGLAPLLACGGDDDGGAGSGTVAFIEIRPGGQLLTAERQTAKLTAVALDADGNEVDATFSWTSSTPDQIAVDADGNVSAVSELGSATIVASAGEISSNPAVIATVELHPGSVLVTDENVVEVGEAFLPEGADETDFPLMDVRLRGIDVPEPGTILVSGESSALGGSVVSAEEEGGEVAVRLQLVSMPELFARYEIDWHIGLEGYGVEEIDEEVSAREIAAAVLPIEQKIKKEWPTSGPFRCTASIGAYLEKNTVDLKLGGDAEFIFKSSRRDASLPPGYLKVAIEGPLTLKGSLALRAKAGLDATGKCELKGRIPIALGPFAIVVAPAIPLGVGVKLKAKVKLATMELGFEGENGFDLGLGFECGPGTAPCHSLDRVDWISNFKPLLEVPRGMKDTKVEMSAQAYFLTGVDLLFGAGTWTFEAFEVTVGPIQSADLGFVDKQMDDRAYASKYDLKLEGKAGAGASVETALKKLLGKDEEDASLGLEVSVSRTLSRSPIGTHTADKTSLSPGEKVRFSVNLDQSTVEYFLIGHNAKSIEFYRKLEDRPTYDHMKSVEITGSNQAIIWDWTPDAMDVGSNEIFAFVKTALPVIELEVAVDSGKKVEVVGLCGGGGTPVPPGAVPGGGDSGCELNGTLTMERAVSTQFGSENITASATLSLREDPTAGAPGLLAFRPYGTWSATYVADASGCTIVTAPPTLTGTLAGDPTQGVFFVYTGAGGLPENVYHGAMTTGVVDATTVMTCPEGDPITIEGTKDFTLWLLNDSEMFAIDPETLRATGTHTDTVNDGMGNTTSDTYTWDLLLTVPPPPPPP